MKLLEKTIWWRGLAFAATLGASTTAFADDVQVTLAEDAAGVTVKIRGVDPGAMADKIVTSKQGALLFVPGDEAVPQRLRPLDRHRLDFVQIGRAGDRVAVRVVQRKKAAGSLSRFMHTTAVAGGFDVRIEDASAKPVAAAAVLAPAANDASFDRQAALSKFAPQAAMPVAAPVAGPAAARPQAPVAAPAAELPAVTATTTAAVPAIAPALAPKPVFADEAAPTTDDAPRQASATADSASIDLGRSAPKIGMAWLATAMLAFSGLGMLWWRKRRPQIEAAQPLRVIARVAIGPKQQVVWIQANGRSFLVGATEQRIDLLADLATEPAAAAQAVAMPVATPLAQQLAAAPMAMQSATPAPESTGRIAAFKQRLRAALGDELAGRNDELLPPHLEMLSGDPRWVGRKESA